MKSSRRPRLGRLGKLSLIALALTVAIAGCKGESQETSDKGPETQQAVGTTQKAPETKTVDSPEAHAQLVNEMAESRKQAQAKQEPIDPEVEKRMKDPAYRKQKDEMLNKLSQVSTAYFKQGIEIRHTRKRPEWRLIDPRLAKITNETERRQKGEELAKKFKSEIDPVLEKPIQVIVFADASESIQVY
jgi:vancomycin resistance protein YoaR